MNNGKDYNCKRGAWNFRHPPPTAKTIGECRFPLRSWTYRHPPPTMTGIKRSEYLVVSGKQPTLKKLNMDLKDITKRLKESSSIITDADLAQAMGFTKQEFYNYKKRGTIPFERILNFCHERKISIEYIFYGSLSATEKEILKLEEELRIEKRLVTEIKDVMKGIVGKD